MKPYTLGTCTAQTNEPQSFTLDSLVEAEAAIKAIWADDPVANYMRQEGFDPDNGCLLLIPGPDYDNLKTSNRFVPSYVRRSELCLEPVMIDPMKIG